MLSLDELCGKHSKGVDFSDTSFSVQGYYISEDLIKIINGCKGFEVDIGGYIISFLGEYQIDEAKKIFEFKNKFLKADPYSDCGVGWPNSWLVIGSSDVVSLVVTLPKNYAGETLFLEFDMAGGDTEAYLQFQSVDQFVSYCLEYNSLTSKGESFDRSTLLLKYCFDAYVYGQKGQFSPNGVRNVFDLSDPETIPDEWL